MDVIFLRSCRGFRTCVRAVYSNLHISLTATRLLRTFARFPFCSTLFSKIYVNYCFCTFARFYVFSSQQLVLSAHLHVFLTAPHVFCAGFSFCSLLFQRIPEFLQFFSSCARFSPTETRLSANLTFLYLLQVFSAQWHLLHDFQV